MPVESIEGPKQIAQDNYVAVALAKSETTQTELTGVNLAAYYRFRTSYAWRQRLS